MALITHILLVPIVHGALVRAIINCSELFQANESGVMHLGE